MFTSVRALLHLRVAFFSKLAKPFAASGKRYVMREGLTRLGAKQTEEPRQKEESKVTSLQQQSEKAIERDEEDDQSSEEELQAESALIKHEEEQKEADKPTDKREFLTEHLKKKGICSRNMAGNLLRGGYIAVNGVRVRRDTQITPNVDVVTIVRTKTSPFEVPLGEDTKIWIVHKPRGVVTKPNDPFGRPNIFDLARSEGVPPLASLSNLDYNAEGVVLLTNHLDLARSITRSFEQLETTFRVRIFGRFDDEKMEKLRQGVQVQGKTIGPLRVDIEKRQTRNTWLMIGGKGIKAREIRRIMQKFSLRVNRIDRLKLGPYKIGNLVHGKVKEVEIAPEFKRYYFDLVKERAAANLYNPKREALALSAQPTKTAAIESPTKQERPSLPSSKSPSDNKPSLRHTSNRRIKRLKGGE